MSEFSPTTSLNGITVSQLRYGSLIHFTSSIENGFDSGTVGFSVGGTVVVDSVVGAWVVGVSEVVSLTDVVFSVVSFVREVSSVLLVVSVSF